MLLLAMSLFGVDQAMNPNVAHWAFLAVGAVALFGIFLPITTWSENRRKERQAYYKAETYRRVAEASGDGGKAVLELLQQESRAAQREKREGMKIGGLVLVGVGLALGIFLSVIAGRDVALCGLIPGLIGVALLVYVCWMAEPLE
jgi:hypothetical protein